MDRMKRIFALSVSIVAIALLASASSWEGSAMMGSYGDFPPGGYFAACNSFPRNTAVEVTNLETGKTVTVIVVRGLDNPGVFMMVSAEAAEALGIRQGKIARVRAVEPRSVSSLAPSAGSRTALDSDFNPRLLAEKELKRLGYEIEEAPSTAAAPVEQAPATVESAPEPATKEPKTAAVPEQAKEAKETAPPLVVPLPASPLAESPEQVQDLLRPAPVVSEVRPVTVPSPEAPRPTATDRPEAINGGKPKPVRTVVLPELPEPEAPGALTHIPPLASAEPLVPREPAEIPEAGPEILAMSLPVPDETPIRVSPAPLPKRFEAPAALPDVMVRPQAKQEAPEPLELSLADPDLPGLGSAVAIPLDSPTAREPELGLALAEPVVDEEEAALAEVLSSPLREADEDGTITLAEPGSPGRDRIVAHELVKPPLRNGAALAALAWPELEADEIPDVVLARLAEPAQLIPATSLAEGEVIFPSIEKPSAVALETPSYGAAETRLALADPEVEPADRIEVLDPLAPEAETADSEVALVDADLESGTPSVAQREAPIPAEGGPEVQIDSPEMEEGALGEVVVVMEPTDLRPPVEGGPVVSEQEPDLSLPGAVAESAATQEEIKTSAVEEGPPVAITTKPAMTTGLLEKGRHYIQVGAYRSESVAAEAVSVLRMDYVIVLDPAADSGPRVWKIFVGPLGRDESGMALLRVRSLGFKDAFLKVGG